VFLTTWHTLPEVPESSINWPALIALRAQVTRKLEELRDNGAIGSSLDAEVSVTASPATYRQLQGLGGELRFLLITSEAHLHAGDSGSEDVIAVTASENPKCVRCWQHRADVGLHAEHPELCARCCTNLSLPGERRVHV
jgi:isoleucyl-tRNA synthetase